VFDFRYHALTLVAVFLALAVGLLLGVAIGDAGLVSSGEKKLRDSLKSDLRAARAQSASLRDELADRDRYADEIYPFAVGGRLENRRIGIIALGSLTERTQKLVQSALRTSGGKLVSVSVVREPLQLQALARAAKGTRYAGLDLAPDLVEPFGRRIGAQYVLGGRLLARAQRALLRAVSGKLERLDAVVLVKPDGKLGEADAKVADAFERGLVDGLTRYGTAVVGAQTLAASPSQIPWFRDRGLASVDNLDQSPGQAALVLLLAGGDRGAYGVSAGADGLLPPVGNALAR